MPLQPCRKQFQNLAFLKIYSAMLSSLTGDKTTAAKEENGVKVIKGETGKVLIEAKIKVLIGAKEAHIGDSLIVPIEGDMTARQEDIKALAEEGTTHDKLHQEVQSHSDHRAHIGTTTPKLRGRQQEILTITKISTNSFPKQLTINNRIKLLQKIRIFIIDRDKAGHPGRHGSKQHLRQS